MKKILAMLLAVMLLASFSVVAFAGPSKEADFVPELDEEYKTQTATVSYFDEDGNLVEEEAEVEIDFVSLEDAEEQLDEEGKALMDECVFAANLVEVVDALGQGVLDAITDEQTKEDMIARVAEKLGVDVDEVNNELLGKSVTVSKAFMVRASLADGGAEVASGIVKMVIKMSDEEKASFVAPVCFSDETHAWAVVDYIFNEDGNLEFDAEVNAIYGYLSLVEPEVAEVPEA